MMADVYKPHVSGVTNSIELTKRHLEKAGHEVYVFAFGDGVYVDDEPRIIRSPGVAVPTTDYFVSLRHTSAARKLIQTMDIVHIHHPFVSGQLGLQYCKPRKIPMVFTNHSRYDVFAQVYVPQLPRAITAGLVRAYMKPFCNAMDLVVAPSPGVSKLLEDMGVSKRIETIPNGVELERFHQARGLPRDSFGIAQSDLVLVYAGRLAPEKNIPFLLRAFAAIARERSNVHLVIIGGGPRQVEAEIHQVASELQIGNRLHFAGMISYQDLPSYLAMCDVYITASFGETFGLSVLEAMGCGLPVAALDSSGLSDIVEHGKTGLLAHADVDSFTSVIRRLCLEPALRSAMGSVARQSSTQYAIERTTGRILDQYKVLVDGGRIRTGM